MERTRDRLQVLLESARGEDNGANYGFSSTEQRVDELKDLREKLDSLSCIKE